MLSVSSWLSADAAFADICLPCSAPQKGSKAQPGSKPQKGSQPSQAKGKPDFDKAGPLADWLKDAAAEMKKQGVNQKFTVLTEPYIV